MPRGNCAIFRTGCEPAPRPTQGRADRELTASGESGFLAMIGVSGLVDSHFFVENGFWWRPDVSGRFLRYFRS
jgi:hypothetical protein